MKDVALLRGIDTASTDATFRILSGLIDEEKYGIISLTINETRSGILPRIRDKKGQCEMKEEMDKRTGRVQSVTEVLIEMGYLPQDDGKMYDV